MAGLRSLALPSEEDDNQRLRTYLLSCTAAEIAAACKAVEAQLQQHQYQTGEHVRDFYRLCFPILLKKILGFEDSQLASPQGSGRAAAAAASSSVNALSGGWLFEASLPGNEAQARALVSLLSPQGPLFSSLLTADNESFVRYVFPTERLPEWVRNLLAADKGVLLLCEVSPLFKNRIVEDSSGTVQVHLDVFEYYIFWFAYYAVCKDTTGVQNGVGGRRAGRHFLISRSAQLRTQIEHWASSIPRLHQEKNQASPGSSHVNPYLHLLQLYLSHFVVLPAGKGVSPRNGLALGRGTQDVGSTSSHLCRGDSLVYTLVEFWLIDDDPVPIPVKVRRTIGGAAGALGVKSSSPQVYVPPGSDLTDALKVLINYLNRQGLASAGGRSSVYSTPVVDSVYRMRTAMGQPESVLSSRSASSLYSSSSLQVSPYSQCLQRPLYRFLLRAFGLWPLGSPVRRMMAVVDVWLDYLEPWNAPLEMKSRDFGLNRSGSRSASQHLTTPSPTNWADNDRSPLPNGSHGISGFSGDQKCHNYVVSNYLYYTQLVNHFLEFAIKFVHLDSEAIFQMICKVLTVLARSKELLVLLRKIDTVSSSQSSGRVHHLSGSLTELAPFVQDQLENWEDGVTVISDPENVEMSSPSSKLQPPPLRFFSMGDNGGHQLLQTLILRGELELQAATAERASLSVQTLDSVKELARKIFVHATGNYFGVLQAGLSDVAMPSFDVDRFNSQAQATGLNRHSWMDVKYRGDWMRRPIEAYEIAWLARLLVKLSDRVNSALGLDGRHHIHSYTPSAPPEPVGPGEFASGEAEGLDSQATGAEGGLKGIVVFLQGQLGKLWPRLQRELQRRNWRVNLRFMAERQFFVLTVLVYCLYRMTYSLARLIFVPSMSS